MITVKPILFNTDMVRAILGGRKTVTRRVVKPQPLWRKSPIQQRGHPQYWANWDDEKVYKAPYHPSDILYVRETWRVQSARRFDADARIEFKTGGDMVRIQFPGGSDQYHSRMEYDAFVSRWADDRWHPSIHMPQAAARIFLRVTDVRVERLQDITEEQAEKEGCTARGGNLALDEFEEVWHRTLNPADRALYGWEENPWVWVIEFARCKKPEATT